MVLYFIFLPIVWVVWHLVWRIKVVGREYLEPYKSGDRGFVIAANHISDLDPVFIVLARFSFHRMNILAKAELFRHRIIGFVLGSFGAVPIERGRGDTGTVNDIVEDCKNGTGLLIFAEGTRTKTGKVGALKSGAFVIAGQAGVDMIPCRIIYGTEKGFMRPFCRVRVCFGEPIPAGQLQIGDPKHAVRELRGLKHTLLDRWDSLFQANRFTEYPVPGSDVPDKKPLRAAADEPKE